MVARSGGSERVSARERARAARLRVDAERTRRDRAVEDAASAFFVAWDERATAERKAGDAVAQLRLIGLGPRQITALLELPMSEVRRLCPDTTTQPSARSAPSTSVKQLDQTGTPAALGDGSAPADEDPDPDPDPAPAPATPARGIPALPDPGALAGATSWGASRF